MMMAAHYGMLPAHLLIPLKLIHNGSIVRGRTMSAIRLLALLVLCSCFAFSPAIAGKRVALVIGNSGYQNAPRLSNPMNDAIAVAAMFEAANFDSVESKFDLSATNLRKALREFSDRTRGADVAVVYFGGHGIELDGTNYLVPVDAALETDGDALDETVSLDRVLFAVEPAKQLRLIILDACRVNPFVDRMRRSTAVSRTTSRGLARVEPTTANTLIAFAAKAGSTASDGNSKNSPFVKALIEYLPRPGLDIRRALGFVRDDVLKSTGNKQEPYVYGSLGGDDAPLVPAASPMAPQADPQAAVRRDYELALQLATRDGWEAFLSLYPDGFYANLAKGQLNKIAAEEARAVAAEKARLAEKERAHLAEQGAKEAELAKAVAVAKATEEARILAEEATRSAQEKAAAAEATRVTEQEKAKRIDKEVAALSSSSEPVDLKLRVALQDELRRVGCNTGAVDGDWTIASQLALELFNKYTGTRFDVKVASTEALNAVKSKMGRTCPLICERGFRAEGSSCVKSNCGAGHELNDDGSCKKVRGRPTVVDKERVRERSSPSARKRPTDQLEQSQESKPVGLTCTKSLGVCRVRCVQLGGGPDCGATICVRLHQACLRSGCWYGRTFSSCGLIRQ
ncbi:putative caspase-like protein [Bradyrhizobium sp. USDA 4502]